MISAKSTELNCDSPEAKLQAMNQLAAYSLYEDSLSPKDNASSVSTTPVPVGRN